MSRSWFTCGCLPVLAGALLLLLIVPLVAPVPGAPGTLPVRDLAYPDSQFADVLGVDLHYTDAGSGSSAFLLAHGFAANTTSWREVVDPLAERGRVIAYDRPGFGLTERPLPGQSPGPGDWPGPNPYAPATQPTLAIQLLDALGVERAILIGHSAGGQVALHAALEHPSRVEALVLISPAVYTRGGPPGWLSPLLRTPQARWYGPLLVRGFPLLAGRFVDSAWHDPATLSDEDVEGYLRPLRAENWDRALWEVTASADQPALSALLGEVTMPVLVIAGDDDRVVPTADSVRLAGELPHAQLVVVAECGHVAHEECPDETWEAIAAFLDTLR